MQTEIEKAIKVLVENISKQRSAGHEFDSNDALKMSQAALNLAHVGQVLKLTAGMA